MSIDQFDISIAKSATDGDLIQITTQFAACIKDHLAFQNLQEHVPGYDRFMAHVTKLQQVSIEAQQGGKLKKEEKEKVREDIYTDFTFAGQHAVMVARYRNDSSLLNNLLFSLKQRAYTKTAQRLPEMPTKLTAKQEGPAGTALVLVNRCLGQGSIEVQITDDPKNEASWRSLERSYTCKITVSGLELVKRYYIRARFHNAVGYGPWSQVISIVLS